MKVTVPNPSVHVWFIVGARFKTNAFSLSLSHRYWHNLGFMDCSSYVTSDKKTIPFCNITYSVTHETQSGPRVNNNIISFYFLSFEVGYPTVAGSSKLISTLKMRSMETAHLYTTRDLCENQSTVWLLSAIHWFDNTAVAY